MNLGWLYVTLGINDHQNDLFVFNLDKKIFTLNLFSEISNN